jgi:hypothetical protein
MQDFTGQSKNLLRHPSMQPHDPLPNFDQPGNVLSRIFDKNSTCNIMITVTTLLQDETGDSLRFSLCQLQSVCHDSAFKNDCIDLPESGTGVPATLTRLNLDHSVFLFSRIPPRVGGEFD